MPGRYSHPPGKTTRNIAKGAAARYLLTCIYYAMRDGYIRSLAAGPPSKPPHGHAWLRAARDRLTVWPAAPAARPSPSFDSATRTRITPMPRGHPPPSGQLSDSVDTVPGLV